MRYLPHTDRDINLMLNAIGVESISELFNTIPQSLQMDRPLNLPKALDEKNLIDHMTKLASKNKADSVKSYIGAGIYNHYAPSAIDHILTRSEFFTAYTPYQPEVSQGTLQAIFEFQSLISLLLEAEVTNASMYDGATACAEAALMSKRIQRKRKKVLLAKNIHPEFAKVTKTYMVNFEDDIDEVKFDDAGRIDRADLSEKLGDDTACLVVGHPNYFGVFEDLTDLAKIVHDAGALLVVTFSEPFAFGITKGPGAFDADIIVGEGQSFLGGMNYGGPSIGLFSTRQKFVRQMPGRVCGMTKDKEDRQGFVLTLSTREQHIRREKATSNICTNSGLCALGTTVFLELMGKKGLKLIAKENLNTAEYLKGKIKSINNLSLPFSSPTFNEFVVKSDKIPAKDLLDRLYKEKQILGGILLEPEYPELDSHFLVNTTELHSKDDLDTFAKALAELSE